MTRPKKEETLAKTKDVHLRMNETEYDLLAERAKANSMTVSDFIRNALVNQKVIIKYEITADVPEIKKLISEFGKIGSNLNQIARHLNEWHSPYPVMANLPESSGQNDHLIAAQKTRERIASETGTSESYVLHPTIRNKLAIDPEAAEVVRKIFLLAIDGNTPTEIAIRLNDEGIPTPGQYFIERHPDTKKYRRSSNKLNWSQCHGISDTDQVGLYRLRCRS